MPFNRNRARPKYDQNISTGMRYYRADQSDVSMENINFKISNKVGHLIWKNQR